MCTKNQLPRSPGSDLTVCVFVGGGWTYLVKNLGPRLITFGPVFCARV